MEQEPWVPESHRHLHRQKDTKYAYAISTKNLQQTARIKLLRDSRRELQKARWSRRQQMRSLQRSPQEPRKFAATVTWL